MSGVLEKKLQSKVFADYVENILNDLKGKKVLIYGAGEAFCEILKKFDIKELDVVAISDLKFKEKGEFEGFKAIPPNEITDLDFDVILMTLVYSKKAIEALDKMGVFQEITEIFEEIIPQESEFINYLEKISFEKYLKKIEKKLKNKKIVIYGTGVFFQVINAYYDLSKLNIIAVSDKKYDAHEENETFLDYKVISPLEIKKYEPDYVLIATRFFINILEDLEENILKNSKIKIRPLIKKPFIELWREIWG